MSGEEGELSAGNMAATTLPMSHLCGVGSARWKRSLRD